MAKRKTLKVPSDFPVHLFKPLQRPKWIETSKLLNERELIEEYDQRIKLLSAHFDCPNDDNFYEQLCQKLLFALFLPDEQRGPGRIPKGEVGTIERQLLLKKVELLRGQKTARSDLGACKLLHSQKGSGFARWKVDTLRKSLQLARRERLQRNRRLSEILRSQGVSGANLLLGIGAPKSLLYLE